MQHSTMPNAYGRLKRRLTLPLMLALTLLTLLLVWPTVSHGQGDSEPTAVPVDVMTQAAHEIDELNRIVAKQDSLIVAQQEYYIELLALKDQHIKSLQETVKDAMGSPTKDFLEKLIWGLAGYGLHAAGSP